MDYITSQTPDKGVQIGKELPINNYSMAMDPDKGVQIGPEPPISNGSIAMANDTIPGFGGNLIEAGIVLNGTKSATYKSTAYPANADGTQRPGAVVEYSSEFSVGEGIGGVGVISELPAGYIAAEFLETNNTKIQVPFSFNLSQDEVRVEMETSVSNNSIIQREGYFKDSNSLTIGQYNKQFSVTVGGSIGSESADLTVGAFYKVWCNFSSQGYSFGSGTTVWNSKVQNYKNNVPFYELYRSDTWQWWTKRKWWRAYKNKELQFDLIPAIGLQGRPVFYNKVDRTEYGNSGTGSLIVGFTLPQARKLGKLPATGGTLTISLPTGYDSNADVMVALETARSKGWTLTIQNYTPENAVAGASTFAFRRVWVRKTQDDNGTYVDADGSRWLVEWCVDMLTPDGSTPDAHGYELFRSVEAALAYWELAPYVDPEVEKEFSQEL